MTKKTKPPEDSKPKKDTIYVEADDEITMVIDRVTRAENKVVALVLPKRATVFQSAVNMKLLKKAANDDKKSIVLITSEGAITSIAAIAGMHVAKTLNSKPELPKKRKTSDREATITADELDVSESSADKTDQASGESEPSQSLNITDSTAAAASQAVDSEDTIKLDNTDSDTSEVEARTAESTDTSGKKFKIPDFTSFRVRVGLAVALVVLLVVGWVFGFVILPKATVTIDTDTSRIDVSTEFVARVGDDATDIPQGIIAAQKVEVEKTDSVTVPATGEKDIGEKASGILTLTNCRQSANGVTVPAGTSFSAEGLNYTTVTSVELEPAVYAGSNCISADVPIFGAVKDVSVQAAGSGTAYNISAQSHASSVSGVSAFGSDMTGGTTEITTVVSADDITKAEDQLSGSTSAEAKVELEEQLATSELFALVETLEESDTDIKRTAQADDQAEEVTVTKKVTYTMLGVLSDDVSSLLTAAANAALAEREQNIRSNGLADAQYALSEKRSASEYALTAKTVASIGPELDEQAIKESIVGKERGEIESQLEAIDGVRSVNVEYSPFWIFQTPSNTDKITIVINEQN